MKARTYGFALPPAWPSAGLFLSLLLACAGCARGTTRIGDFSDLDDTKDPSTGDVDPDAGMDGLDDDDEGDGDEGDGDLGDGDVGPDPGDGDSTTPPDAGIPVLPDAATPAEPDAGGDGDGDADADPACAGLSSCVQPVSLGSVSGDTATTPVSTQGSTSGFFSVKVTEDDHGFASPKDLKVRGELSTSGADFDLYLYADGNGCSVLSDVSESTAVEQVDTSWGDDQGILGSDSGRTVYFEVRHKSGMCSPTSTWTLSVTGN